VAGHILADGFSSQYKSLILSPIYFGLPSIECNVILNEVARSEAYDPASPCPIEAFIF
jgi:hypothetical protein